MSEFKKYIIFGQIDSFYSRYAKSDKTVDGEVFLTN